MKNQDILILNSFSNILKTEMRNSLDYFDYVKVFNKISNEKVPNLIDLVVEKKLFVIHSHHKRYNPGYNSNIPYYFDVIMNIERI